MFLVFIMLWGMLGKENLTMAANGQSEESDVSGLGFEPKTPKWNFNLYLYNIKAYDVKIQVDTDNTYHVQETLKVYFNEERHGIYRYIPQEMTIQREDGSRVEVSARVNNVDCGSDVFMVERDGDYRIIEIGDTKKTIIGEHTYHISYDYIYGNDQLEGADEFFYNVIANAGEQTQIENMTFSIEMPKEVDKDNISIYYGGSDSIETEGLSWDFDGRKIEGKLDLGMILEPGEYVTAKILMEEGYFTSKDSFPLAAIATISLCNAFFLVSLIYWAIFGRETRLEKALVTYPPKGLNCAEMAFLYRGSVVGKDIVPLVVELAYKGYLKITDTGKKTGFAIEIQKPYDGDDKIEQAFMEGLSQYGQVIQQHQLMNSFYKTINAIRKQLKKEWGPEFFVQSVRKLRFVTLVFAAIPYLVLLIPTNAYYESDPATIFLRAILPYVCVSLLIYFIKKRNFFWIAEKIFIVVLMAAMVIEATQYIGDGLSYAGFLYWSAYILCLICNCIQIFFFCTMKRRTKTGHEMLCKVVGLKDFLKTAAIRRKRAV